MKLFQSLLLSVLFVSALSFTGCNEEPVTSGPTTKTPTLSKLTLPAGAVITGATFNIFVEDATNNGLDVHAVNVPWAEATETWNIFYNKTALQFDPTVLGSFNSVYSWHSVNITALVQGWYNGTITNYGILINQPISANDISNLRSREYNSGGVSDPYLEVTYTVGGGAPVTVQEPAFEDTYIWSIFPDDNFGSEQYVRVAYIDTYIKHALVKFDIESTPQQCYQEETAWAANNNVPGSIRYVTRGNWATYLTYGNVAKTVNIYAGKNILVGTASFSAVSGGNVTITMSLAGGWVLNPTKTETVKIQGYSSTPPANNPAPGQFTTYRGSNLTVTVPAFNFYGIHLDVRKPITCP